MASLPQEASQSPLHLIELSEIDCSDRLRPVEPAHVEAMAVSLSEKGQLQPIIVRPMPNGGNGVKLVAGGHRVAAAKLIGWAQIGAVLLNVSDEEARLIEIDENLIRNELSELDRALSLAERKRLYEEIHPETKHGGKRPKKPADQVANMATWSRFSKDAAKKTGFSERTIRRAVELAAALTPEAITTIRGTKLVDNQAQLLALSELKPADQVTVAGLIKAGGASNVANGRRIAGLVPPAEHRPDEDVLVKLEAHIGRLTEAQLVKVRDMAHARLHLLNPTAYAPLGAKRPASKGAKA